MESFLPAILYSFRRCPYAMRARYTLALLSQSVELREVVLKNKPEALLKLGGRSTVPQLIVDDKRYPESFDIMMWAINQAPASSMSLQLWPQCRVTQTKIQTWVSYNDHCFKYWLDRYKYADRHPEFTEEFYRQKGERFLKRLDVRLSRYPYLMGESMTLADVAIFPFIRQFAGVKPTWFADSNYPNLKLWLSGFVDGKGFAAIMSKYEPWQEGQPTIIFPTHLNS